MDLFNITSTNHASSALSFDIYLQYFAIDHFTVDINFKRDNLSML
jgi:hypothetical protein